MRSPFLLLPMTLALAASFPVTAQEGPRVLFCAGECVAVDAKGARTPVRKGSRLSQGQRLETGPGGYAQVKLNDAAAIGIGEQARIGFELNTVVLDEGRVRMIGGEAFGKPIMQPIELRTTDGTLVLRGADIEAKTGLGAATPTIVKVNAGDARLNNVALPTQGIQEISRGRLGEAILPVSDLAPRPRASDKPMVDRPVDIAAAPFTMPQVPVLRNDRANPVVELPFRPLPVPPAGPVAGLIKPPLLPGERMLSTEFAVGDRTFTLEKVVEDPRILSGSVVLQTPTIPTTSTGTISPILDRTVLQSPDLTFQVAPTLTQTTSTSNLSTAPSLTSSTIISPTISPITVSPTTTLIRR